MSGVCAPVQLVMVKAPSDIGVASLSPSSSVYCTYSRYTTLLVVVQYSTVKPGYNGTWYNGNLATTDRFLGHIVFLVRITENLSIAL